mmetsp:Transcript_728/g.1949  ORF Transcript_728/g.1949 Transcript_728/m.1949 type:complete len:221 (-) Transcript_728:76-738(-)|eukprot:CAMPEP_0202884750 /NCGR_PEP_ID=MMETSP1391-20130828/41307_1 /ASSEMBLY_ACC=CAM_ASM_000867 /TAXON_ID=1034604 /ORGANISM="Chlamydomonas leiostraca, Strain SAG 11-49" /LENGTH=220 /DNA_ID=CAMNT_0049567977 /DNA_START=306 /DNA_END=971 /DNA_ORIENTATION=-
MDFSYGQQSAPYYFVRGKSFYRADLDKIGSMGTGPWRMHGQRRQTQHATWRTNAVHGDGQQYEELHQQFSELQIEHEKLLAWKTAAHAQVMWLSERMCELLDSAAAPSPAPSHPPPPASETAEEGGDGAAIDAWSEECSDSGLHEADCDFGADDDCCCCDAQADGGMMGDGEPYSNGGYGHSCAHGGYAAVHGGYGQQRSQGGYGGYGGRNGGYGMSGYG